MLPHPFAPLTQFKVGFTMQLAIIPPEGVNFEDAATFLVLKHYNFSDAHSVPLIKEKIKQPSGLLFGFCRCPDWFQSERVFQYMFERLGGVLWSYKQWPQTGPTIIETKTISERQEGWKFIREKGPRSDYENQFMEWTDLNVNSDTPIKGWPEAKVTIALKNYQRGRQNAKPIDRWIVTIADMKGWFINNVIAEVGGTLRQHSISWVGFTRPGKSCGATTMAFTSADVECELSRLDHDPQMPSDTQPMFVIATYIKLFQRFPSD